ncbi:carbohydrate esterase family 1 protein [Bisporella sp. PMI_857]|nr:carbohydrate esterase family 1 protein [Bisporella sp. PMI_857]
MFRGSLLLISTALSTVVLGALQQLQGPIKNFGPNPTNVTFYIYVPAKLQPNPPIVVDPHWCHGTAQAAFAGSQLATLADTYGYIVIYPDAPHDVDDCWDVSSKQTLTHNGGGDSLGIVSMVRYTLATYYGNPKRVFSYGVSSGAMMTNVLLGAYPDVFAAGSAWAGVAFGCFAGDGFAVWSDACATGKIIKTGAEWKAIVEAAYPEYKGWRPKLQIFHGSADEVLYVQNFQEEIKEWTAVLGLPSSPVQTLQNNPQSNWTTYIYGDAFQATLAGGVTHNIPVDANIAVKWFDLTCTGANCFSHGGPGTTPVTSLITSTVTSAPTSTPSSPTGGGTLPKYAQCGGSGWAGSGTCVAGTTCVYSNQWYSQCL